MTKMTKNHGREGIESIFYWVFVAKYFHRFLSISNLAFVRPDKGKQGLAGKIFNTFCEWLDGTVCYSPQEV